MFDPDNYDENVERPDEDDDDERWDEDLGWDEGSDDERWDDEDDEPESA